MQGRNEVRFDYTPGLHTIDVMQITLVGEGRRKRRTRDQSTSGLMSLVLTTRGLPLYLRVPVDETLYSVPEGQPSESSSPTARGRTWSRRR